MGGVPVIIAIGKESRVVDVPVDALTVDGLRERLNFRIASTVEVDGKPLTGQDGLAGLGKEPVQAYRVVDVSKVPKSTGE